MATVTVATLKSTFWQFMGELYRGTATGGSTTTLIDTGLIGYTSATWPAKIVGQQLRITGGSASGDLRMVGKFDPSDGVIYPNRNPSAAIANTDTYELWGTAINGGTPLTDLFNATMRDLKPVTDTQITIVSYQRMYDVSAVVQSKRDIRGVYLRLLDNANLEPYRINDLAPGLGWWAHDRGGAGTESVTLELMTGLILQPSNQQLWLRGETTFPALVDDTSTVDADYRDWLAWEAILELAHTKQAMGNYDKSRWDGLETRAIRELNSHRARWLLGHEPVPISVWP